MQLTVIYRYVNLQHAAYVGGDSLYDETTAKFIHIDAGFHHFYECFSHFTSETTMSSHWERHSPSDYDDLSSIHTYSTSSTNATLDNQPGAGKTLDYVYQRLGRKLVDGIRKVIGIIGDRSRTKLAIRDDSDDEFNDQQSMISNETVDDLPGPGRTLDKHLYQPLGRRLEKTLGNTADRL